LHNVRAIAINFPGETWFLGIDAHGIGFIFDRMVIGFQALAKSMESKQHNACSKEIFHSVSILKIIELKNITLL
jgi:hypothetical protein